MQTALRITFTVTIVILIVLPLPPSTIIGVALAANPKTGKYMNQKVYSVIQVIMGYTRTAITQPVFVLADRREISARNRIQTGTYRL
jgi:hypothetical protein